MTEILDESHFVSKERAIRGAKIGAKVGAGFSALLLASLALSPAETVQYLSTDTAEGLIGLTAMVLINPAYGAAAGALVDSLRPTSRAARDFIDTFLGIKREAEYFYHYFADQRYKETLNQLSEKAATFKSNAGRIAYDILRPQVSAHALEQKSWIMAGTTIQGAVGGVGLYAIANVSRLLDKFASPTYTNPVSWMVDNPHLPIIGGAAIGLGLSVYVFTFHRPTDHDSLSVTNSENH